MFLSRIVKNNHPVRRAKSFKYAFAGIFHALLNEANFRIQVTFVIFVVILGLILGLDTTEWSLIVLANGLLLSAEMVNTVVEEFIDFLIKDYDDGARIIKDLSAGFVLTAGIVTLIITFLIFWPKISAII